MRVLHISFSDIRGGAAIRASRLHQELLNQNIESHLLVAEQYGNLENTHCAYTDRLSKLEKRIYKRISRKLSSYRNDPENNGFSINLFPDKILPWVKKLNPDIIHLNWIGQNLVRIENIPKLSSVAPTFWTLDDMWPFCGAEHYDWSGKHFQEGYNRPDHKGLNFNKATQTRKAKAFSKSNIHFISPSNWMNDCAKRSLPLRKTSRHRFSVISNGLDTETYKPISREKVRDRFGIDNNEKVILFGAHAPNAKIKGGDLLIQSLDCLVQRKLPFKPLVFGTNRFKFGAAKNGDTLGRVFSDKDLNEIYNLADVFVTPSRLECFGQVASEAQACGIPVVSFDTSGLKEVVEHRVTGYRAKCFDPSSFADGIEYIVGDEARRKVLSMNAREQASKKFSIPLIAKEHILLYSRELETSKSRK